MDALGDSLTVELDVTYVGSTRASFQTSPQIIGSSAFSLNSQVEFPATLQPNGQLTVALTYRATTTSQAQAQLSMPFTLAAGPPGTPAQSGLIQLNLLGQAPNIFVSYALDTNGNVLALPDGGVLAFDPTRVGQTGRATVRVANQGSGSGTVAGVTLSGEAFRLFGLALTPVALPSGTALQFEIRYSPLDVGEHTGSLAIEIGDGSTITVELRGSAVGSTFSYELIHEAVSQPIGPAEPVTIPPTEIGDRYTATVLVQNTGTAEGLVNTIAVSGTGFTVADLPFLPATLLPTETLTFTLEYRPTTPGAQTGRLRIGNVVLDLLGTALGANLRFSYSIGGQTGTAVSGDALFFNPGPVGSKSIAKIIAKNVGLQDATVPSIGVNGNRAVFQLQNLPALPLTLRPEESVELEVAFTPNTDGLLAGQLLIGNATFSLSGFGESPDAPPEFQFTGVGGDLQLLDQPALGVELAQPYPIPLLGVLTMIPDAGALPDDPSVQFATGGRSVAFRVPANSTRSVFSGGSERAAFQTGSVASTLRFRVALTTEVGYRLTPETSAPFAVTAPATVPALRTIVAQRSGTNALQVVIIGHTPTRSLSRLRVEFTSASGSKIGDGFEFDLSSASKLWFGSRVSEAFGGQFSVSAPFTIEGDSSRPNLGLGSVQATVVNEIGESAPVSTTQF